MRNMQINVSRSQLNEWDKNDKIIIKFLDCFDGCQVSFKSIFCRTVKWYNLQRNESCKAFGYIIPTEWVSLPSNPYLIFWSLIISVVTASEKSFQTLGRSMKFEADEEMVKPMIIDCADNDEFQIAWPQHLSLPRIPRTRPWNEAMIPLLRLPRRVLPKRLSQRRLTFSWNGSDQY